MDKINQNQYAVNNLVTVIVKAGNTISPCYSQST